jgi:hypothetical protein
MRVRLLDAEAAHALRPSRPAGCISQGLPANTTLAFSPF